MSGFRRTAGPRGPTTRPRAPPTAKIGDPSRRMPREPKLVAAAQAISLGGEVLRAGAVWMSTDAGVTWTNRTAAQAGMGQQSWEAVASDATGNNLVAVGPGSGIWASTDGGATWTDRTPPDPKFQASFGNHMEEWQSVASDATGTHSSRPLAQGTSGRRPTAESRGRMSACPSRGGTR
jgi:hypothetical protein